MSTIDGAILKNSLSAVADVLLARLTLDKGNLAMDMAKFRIAVGDEFSITTNLVLKHSAVNSYDVLAVVKVVGNLWVGVMTGPKAVSAVILDRALMTDEYKNEKDLDKQFEMLEAQALAMYSMSYEERAWTKRD